MGHLFHPLDETQALRNPFGKHPAPAAAVPAGDPRTGAAAPDRLARCAACLGTALDHLQGRVPPAGLAGKGAVGAAAGAVAAASAGWVPRVQGPCKDSGEYHDVEHKGRAAGEVVGRVWRGRVRPAAAGKACQVCLGWGTAAPAYWPKLGWGSWGSALAAW